MITYATLSKSDITKIKDLLEEKETTAVDVVPCECAVGQCECHLHEYLEIKKSEKMMYQQPLNLVKQPS